MPARVVVVFRDLKQTERNQNALVELKTKHSVDVRPFPEDVLEKLKGLSEQALEEVAVADDMSAKVYASFKDYRDKVSAYHKVSEQAYINARD